MALSGKHIKLDTILEKVYRDYGFETDLDWNDAIEWAAEALDLIGAPRVYTNLITDGQDLMGHPDPINITNHRGDLPCNLHQIVQVREFCTNMPMTYATNSFHTGTGGSNGTTVDCVTNNCDNNTADVVPSTTLDDNQNCNPFFNFNPNATANTPFAANLPTVGGGMVDDLYTYTVSGDKIFTSFKSGQVEMAYTAYPVDEKGFPMIPQETRFQNAVRDYIAHRLSFKLAIQGKFQPAMADKLEQNWLFYCQSAANKSRMPSIDQMESLKNQWVKLIPNINEHDTAFRYLNIQERRYNSNSR